MIKINLATRKQSAASVDQGKASGKGGLANPFAAGFKIDARLDDLKDLPIRKLAIGALSCFAASYLLDGYKEDELKKWDGVIDKLTSEQSKLKADLGKTKGFEDIKKALEADELTLRTKIEVIQKLLTDRQLPPKLLTTLSSTIPSEVWLKSLRIEGSEVNFKGNALGFNPISDFMKALNETAYFTDVRLQGTQQDKDTNGQEVAAFELVAKRR